MPPHGALRRRDVPMLSGRQADEMAVEQENGRNHGLKPWPEGHGAYGLWLIAFGCLWPMVYRLRRLMAYGVWLIVK